MSTRYLFSKSSIDGFENRTGTTIGLDEKQTAALTSTGTTEVRLDQIDSLIRLLYPTMQDQIALIERGPCEAFATSVTLFVVNEATWGIMKKKETEKDRMLPMLTVPWFYVEPTETGKTGSSGACRHEVSRPTFRFDSSHQTIIVEGECGDFCGILDARIARRKHQAKPLLLPGDVGRRALVPLYERESYRLTVNLTGRNDVVLYPKPSAVFDYTYSENPKVFYEHGLRVATDGAQVRLKTGRGKEYNLRGEVTLLVGIPYLDLPDDHDIITAHIWLRVLALMLGGGTQL